MAIRHGVSHRARFRYKQRPQQAMAKKYEYKFVRLESGKGLRMKSENTYQQAVLEREVTESEA